MFDNNRDIKAGRDINIHYSESLSSLTNEELLSKRKDAQLILKQESKSKLRTLKRMLIVCGLVFMIIYFIVPMIVSMLSTAPEFIRQFLSSKNPNYVILSLVASIATIYNSVFTLLNRNNIQKKQDELIQHINLIIKERKYLHK